MIYSVQMTLAKLTILIMFYTFATSVTNGHTNQTVRLLLSESISYCSDYKYL